MKNTNNAWYSLQKQRGILETAKYFRVLPLLLISLLLFVVLYAGYSILLSEFEAMQTSALLPIYQCLFWVVYIALVLLMFYLSYTQRAYFYFTGRDFRKDFKNYKRSYQELLEYFIDADPHKLDTQQFVNQPWYTTDGIIFGYDDQNRLIKIPSDSECNISVFGPPGSGKTSGLAIINAITFNGSVLAVDIKGDIYNFVSKYSDRHIIRFCPDNPNALQESCAFDPLMGINIMTSTDRKLYLSSMATILIPDEGGEAGNYFSSRARKMFIGITHILLQKNPETSFPDIIHAILEGNIFDWIEQAMDGDCIEAKEQLSSFYGNNEKNITSAYDALTTALVDFSNPLLDHLLSGGAKSISIKDLENGSDIYLQIAQEHLDAYAPLFTLLIQSLSTAFTKRADSSTGIKNRPILMILDEFPQLTFSYKLINANLSTLRSKSVICMLIQQNQAQTEYRYNEVGARSILGNCNYQIFLGSNDTKSSKIYSEIFGQRKVLKISTSETKAKGDSTGRSIQESTELIYPPTHFGDLPANGKMVVYFKGKYTECLKINCYKYMDKLSEQRKKAKMKRQNRF